GALAPPLSFPSFQVLKDNSIGIELLGNLHDALRDNLPNLTVDITAFAVGMRAEAFLETST
ncbi:MAG: hypothetical protein ABWU13_25850, partial [Limnospira maxima]